MKDICCIGHITLDKIITPNTEVYMNGGTAFYFAYGMNHLPKKVSFQLVTAMGEKDIKAVRTMREQGIDVVCHHSRNTVFFENKYGHNMNNRQQRVLAKADPFTVGQLEPPRSQDFPPGLAALRRLFARSGEEPGRQGAREHRRAGLSAQCANSTSMPPTGKRNWRCCATPTY